MLTQSASTDFDRYQKQLHSFPMLGAEEEARLAKRWRDYSDRAAVHRLLASHLRLVVTVARSFRGYHLPLAELVSEGNVGLVEAAKRFDPEKGVRFSTYALWWIAAAMQEYILRSWSLVRMGTKRSERVLFYNLRKLKSRISALQEGDLHPDQVRFIANHLDVREQDVVEMNRRIDGDLSLNMPMGQAHQAIEWQDVLVDVRPNQEDQLGEDQEFERRRQIFREALTELNDRERYVFEMHRLAEEPMSLRVLALELGVSHERVRQIDVRAFDKVCEAVRRRFAPAISRNS
jgi:RNA polymerase sigma-32 factor